MQSTSQTFINSDNYKCVFEKSLDFDRPPNWLSKSDVYVYKTAVNTGLLPLIKFTFSDLQ